VKVAAAPADHEMTFRISLVQPKFSVLEEHLYAVSDPASPRYGQHLSKEHVEELTAPSPEALAAVNDWLFSHGFDVNELSRSVSKDWVKIKTTVQKAEQMLNTVSGDISVNIHEIFISYRPITPGRIPRQRNRWCAPQAGASRTS